MKSFARSTDYKEKADKSNAIQGRTKELRMIKHGSKTVDTIFVHCSATRPEWMSDKPLKDKVAEIGRWHKDKGSSQIGYHWVIDRDGSVAPAAQSISRRSRRGAR